MNRFPELIESSLYSRIVPLWVKAFGEDNVLILRMEELSEDAEKFADQVDDFLEISNSGRLLPGKVNSSSSPKYLWLARLGQFMADSLRFLKLYFLLNWLKNFGLKKLFFTGGEQYSLSQKEIGFLQERLAEEDVKYNYEKHD